jgi:hypothetical protein
MSVAACGFTLRCLAAAPPLAAGCEQAQRGVHVGRGRASPALLGLGQQVSTVRVGRGCASPALLRQRVSAAVRRRTVCAAGSGTARSLLAEPWDAAPQNWRRFWATKLAAAVVESDSAAETVRVTPVEMSGLNLPPSQEEAQRRLRTNVTLFRQNYVCCALACLAAGAIRNVALLAALACAAAAAVVHSDRLLGELSLAMDGQLAWNAKRVAGVDRALLRSALPCGAVLCLALSPAQSARWLLTSSCLAVAVALLHAMMRPVDLEAVMGSFIGDLTSAKTRCVAPRAARAAFGAAHKTPCLRSEDVGRSFSAAAQGISGWWAQRKATPAAPVPIIVVERQQGSQPPPQQPQQPRPPPQKRLPGF